MDRARERLGIYDKWKEDWPNIIQSFIGIIKKEPNSLKSGTHDKILGQAVLMAINNKIYNEGLISREEKEAMDVEIIET